MMAMRWICIYCNKIMNKDNFKYLAKIVHIFTKPTFRNDIITGFSFYIVDFYIVGLAVYT